MSGTTCSSCGNILRADALFCPKCGVEVASHRETISSSAGKTPKFRLDDLNLTQASVSSGSSAAEGVRSRPLRRISRRAIVGVVALVVVIVVVLSVYYYEYRPGGPQNPFLVKVSQVIWTHDGSALSTGPGFMKHAGTSIQVATSLSCSSFFGSPSTCDTGSVYLMTPGFGVVNTNAPASWSSGDSGSTFSVQVLLSVPSYSYSGTLAIDLH